MSYLENTISSKSTSMAPDSNFMGLYTKSDASPFGTSIDPHILEKIFKFLPPGDLKSTFLASTRLKKASISVINDGGVSLKSLDIKTPDEAIDFVIEYQLVKVDLSGFDITDEHLEKLLKGADIIKSLNLSDCTRITDLAPITLLKQLQFLNLLGCTGITDLAPIALLKQLRLLNLSSCTGITDLAPIALLKQLQFLNLLGCTGITDLAPIALLKQLQVLYLSGCTGITDLAPIALLKQLQVLYLLGCTGITDLAPIAQLKQLQLLNLWGCTGITDLAPIALLKQLQKLDLSDCTRITDLAPIAQWMCNNMGA